MIHQANDYPTSAGGQTGRNLGIPPLWHLKCWGAVIMTDASYEPSD